MLEDTKAALTKPKDFEQFSLPQCEHKNFRAGLLRWKTSAIILDCSRMPSSQTVTQSTDIWTRTGRGKTVEIELFNNES